MLAASLIMFREGLEAALVVGIVIGYLTRTGQRGQLRYAWLGVICAVFVSVATAVGLTVIGSGLEEPYEQIFEGTTMLVAVLILTWMIFWMRYQGRFIKRELEHKMQSAAVTGAAVGIFGIAFLAVFREGIETALLLSANAFADNAAATLLGSAIGLALAVAAGYAIFAMSVRIDLRLFFNVTSLFLLVFAAGLFAHAIHEYQEIGWLPFLTQPAYNIEAVLSNESLLGSVLRVMVGYNSSPSVLEVVAYIGYWVVVFLGVRWLTRRLVPVTLPAGVSASQQV